MNTHLTITELGAGLTEIRQAPRDGGRLEMIVSRPDQEQRIVLDVGNLSVENGLEGDNWLARGSSSTEDGRAHPEAQITLMNARVTQLVAQDRARWALAGDQLYVDLDLSEANLPPGQQITIGSAILEITALPHTGCKKFVERFGADAMRWVNSPEGRQLRLRGIYARVIQPGSIRTGDVVQKCPVLITTLSEQR